MTAVAPTGPLPLVARSACALLLLDYPPQPLAERNERGPVSQLERNLAGLSVDRGVGVDFARPLDNPYATHGAIPRENARIDGWFPVADVAPSVIGRRAPPASTTQVSNLLLMTLVNPLPFARLMTIGLHPYIAAYGLSGHTAAASSVGGPVPSAWHGTALHSERSGRHQCARAEGACRQAGDHRFGQHGCSAEPSIVLENGPSFALVNWTRRLLHRPGYKRLGARVHVYLEEEPTGTPRAAKLLPGDEARRIGANIANRRRCYGGPQLLERSWGVICTRIVRRPSMLRAPAVAEYTNERY
jgi:hypothetical protein